MRIVTHEFTDTLTRFKEIPPFRFENKFFNQRMETSNRTTILGQVINRIYVESLEFPKNISDGHLCLFIVSIPYYEVFKRMYQKRFGDVSTSFDDLTAEHILTWIMSTYHVKTHAAKKLLDYFRGSLLKMVYNPDAVSTFLSGHATETYYHSYTYETIYKYLMNDLSISANDYLRALAKYNHSNTAVVKWLMKKLDKDASTLGAIKLYQWLQGKSDIDLLVFAKEVL